MKLAPTKVSVLLAIGVFAMALGWSLSRLWPKWFDQSPSVPWLSAYMLVLMALSLLGWTFHVRTRIRPEPGKPRIHPLVAARTVALAMAASRVGAIAGGFYLGFVVASLSDLDAPAGRQRAIVSVVATVGGISLAAIAMWLERICQVPKPPAGSATSAQQSA